jgi:predicted O-methyltransferase YrrM
MTKTNKLNIRWTPRRLTFLFFFWLGRRHPSMAGHFLTDHVRYALVERGFPSGAAKHVAEVRDEFETRAAQGQFKERWFDMNLVPWCVTFSKVLSRTDPLRILEIGSWEGRSTLFFLTYFKQAQLTAVDTWEGSDEWHYMATSNLQDLEARFDHNVGLSGQQVTKRKGSSLYVLPNLLEEKQKFDLIYVDGSHLADDAITDAINAWRLLEQGGIVIFDDVMWPAYRRTHANTAWAINSFLKHYAGEYKVLHAQYQLILQKKTAFEDQTADWITYSWTTSRPPESTDNTHDPREPQQLLG